MPPSKSAGDETRTEPGSPNLLHLRFRCALMQSDRLSPSAPADPPARIPARDWTIIALLIGVSLLSGAAFTWPVLRWVEIDTATAARIVGWGWAPWAAVAAFIVWLARVAPLDPDRWRVTLPLHLAACAGLTLGGYLLADHLRGTFVRQFSRGDRPLFFPPPTASADLPRSMSGGDPPEPRAFPRRMPDMGDAPRPDATTVAKLMLSRSMGSGLMVPVYILLVAVTQATRNHRRALATTRLAEQAAHQLAQARLRALQSQLQPHFLFNTLNAVTSYIATRPRVAEEMLCSLGDLLRRILMLGDRTEISLEEELELVDLYLDLQRHRFSAQLEVVRHIDARLLQTRVPPLILQPIVENAIVHGIGASGRPGRIELRIEHVGERLRLSVIDHQPPPPPDAARPPSNGVGLQNVRHRLITLYGPRAELHAHPRPEGGFLTEINLPPLSASAL